MLLNRVHVFAVFLFNTMAVKVLSLNSWALILTNRKFPTAKDLSTEKLAAKAERLGVISP